jgi:hypothetical protein
LVNEAHFVMTSPFQNCPHLPTTQCACVDKQRNGDGGREEDLLENTVSIFFSECVDRLLWLWMALPVGSLLSKKRSIRCQFDQNLFLCPELSTVQSLTCSHVC